MSLLTPFLAYIAAEEGPHLLWHELLGRSGEPFFSGVLAAVAAGLYVGRKSPTIMSSASRLEGSAVWDVMTFLLNGFAFVLIGLQLPQVLAGLEAYTAGALTRYAVLVSLTVARFRGRRLDGTGGNSCPDRGCRGRAGPFGGTRGRGLGA